MGKVRNARWDSHPILQVRKLQAAQGRNLKMYGIGRPEHMFGKRGMISGHFHRQIHCTCR